MPFCPLSVTTHGQSVVTWGALALVLRHYNITYIVSPTLYTHCLSLALSSNPRSVLERSFWNIEDYTSCQWERERGRSGIQRQDCLCSHGSGQVSSSGIRGEYCCNCNSPMIYSSAWSNIQNCLNMAFTHTAGFLKHSLPTPCPLREGLTREIWETLFPELYSILIVGWTSLVPVIYRAEGEMVFFIDGFHVRLAEVGHVLYYHCDIAIVNVKLSHQGGSGLPHQIWIFTAAFC